MCRVVLNVRTIRMALFLTVAVMSLPISAQSEGGLLFEVGAEKKVTKNFSLGLDGEFRSRNNFKTADRWGIGVKADYKLTNWLKADAGYKLLYTNFHEDINYKSSGAYNTWRPSYWGTKHRIYASLSACYKLPNNVKLSLRERWQYTYRPETTVTRWDFDDEKWEDKMRGMYVHHQLRSRFQVEYDKKKARFTPFAGIELYNGWGVEKIRYNVGTDIRLDKQQSLSVFYRFQNICDSEDEDPNMHYLGFGYKFKF